MKGKAVINNALVFFYNLKSFVNGEEGKTSNSIDINLKSEQMIVKNYY